MIRQAGALVHLCVLAFIQMFDRSPAIGMAVHQRCTGEVMVTVVRVKSVVKIK